MRARILSIVLTVIMMLSLVPTAMAATVDEINQDQVFLKQERNGTCTLASTAMMLRRTAMLRGDRDWASITEASCREAFWIAGRGLPYKFEYDGMTVNHGRLPGGEANRQILIDMLAEHPEGFVLHAPGVPHGILLTDYTDGVFYCADPAQNVANGRVPIDQAHGTRVENSYAYWYVVTPDVAVEASPAMAAAQLELPEAAADETGVSRLVNVLSGAVEEDETAGCMIAQAMALA